MRFHSSGGSAFRASPSAAVRASLVRRVATRSRPAPACARTPRRRGSWSAPPPCWRSRCAGPCRRSAGPPRAPAAAASARRGAPSPSRRAPPPTTAGAAPARSAVRRRRSPRSPAGAPMSRETRAPRTARSCPAGPARRGCRTARRPAPGPARSCRRRSGPRNRKLAHRPPAGEAGVVAPDAPAPPARSPSSWPMTRAPSSSSRRSSRAESLSQQPLLRQPGELARPPRRRPPASTRSLPSRRQRDPARSAIEIALSGQEPVGHVPRGERRSRLERRPAHSERGGAPRSGPSTPVEDLHGLGDRRARSPPPR